MLSSRLSKLSLAALIAALAIPAAASASMVTYIDAKNVWVASPDGAIKRQLTQDGTAESPFHVPSPDDHGNVAAIKGGITNSKILVHLAAGGKRTDNVLPWKIGPVTNFGPSSARLSPDGAKIAYTYLWNHGPYTGGIEPRMAIVTPTNPGLPTQPMIDQPGWEMPTWIDGKLVVAKNGVALLEMEPLQFTQFLEITTDPAGQYRIVSTEVSRSKERYLVDMSRTADNSRGLVLYAHAGAFPGGTVPAGCQVPTQGTPSFTHGLSPDGTQVAWKDDRGVMVGTFDPGQRDGAGWCEGTVVRLTATGDEPTFGNATLSVPQEPAPPAPDAVVAPPSDPAPLVAPAAPRVRTATGATAAPTVGDEVLELIVPAATKTASLRGGLRVDATAPGAGTMRAKLAYKGRTLGTATTTVKTAGRLTLKLKLTRSGRKAVKRLKGRKVQLRIMFTPKGGGARLTTSASVTLR